MEGDGEAILVPGEKLWLPVVAITIVAVLSLMATCDSWPPEMWLLQIMKCYEVLSEHVEFEDLVPKELHVEIVMSR